MEYSNAAHLASSIQIPTQHGLTSPDMTAHRGALRQVPPSAVPHEYTYQTPSQRSTRSLPYASNFMDSPFMSPPPTATTRIINGSQSTRSSRTTPQNVYRPVSYGSPFQSPPASEAPKKVRVRRQTPQPLVLDPSASRQHSYSSNHNTPHSLSSNHHMHQGPYTNPSQQAPSPSFPTTDMAQKFLQVATGRIRDQLAVTGGDTMGVHSTPALTHHHHHHSGETAASLARHAPKAGYLQKLGQNIPEFKRRFFVLKAETNLYYYLSPNDLEPRGKISLEGTQLEPLEQLPDGRFRFVIQDTQETTEDISPRRIILEARSEEIGKEWMQQLQEERVSTLKEKVDELTSQVQSQKFRIADLERQVDDFKLVEKDRDGALEDARQWKDQFQRLDEALRLLTQRMRQPPTVSSESSAVRNPDCEGDDHAEEKKEMDPGQTEEDRQDSTLIHSMDETPTKNNQSSKKKDLPSSLLDDAFHAVDDTNQSHHESIEEIMTVPGTYFSGLANACQQQRDSLRLAAEEAATAVDDVQEANSQVEEMKKRMERAEKHLTKIWEENCTIRKSLKQKKREKRVLVREYKALQQANRELEEKASAAAAQRLSYSIPSRRTTTTGGKENDVGRPMEDTILGSDEERLIDELEDHVASSIQLHQRLLAANKLIDLESDTEMNTSMDNSEAAEDEMSNQGPGEAVEATSKTRGIVEQASHQPASASPGLVSLMDNEASEESSEGEDDDDLSINEYQSISPSVVSSVGAEFGSVAEFSQQSEPSIPPAVSTESTPERPNPVLQLHKDDDDDIDEYDRQPTLCSASTQSHSTASKSVITDNGQATARLTCPLADVVERKGNPQTDSTETHAGMAVYHLTFYSRKIGIQFQKAPPAPVKPKGLLTAAMTADLNGEANGSDKTAAELRNVAAISSLASGRNAKNEEVCPVALPKDAVLVCGFHGFDESGMNQKPKLGARLVAFDGVSVEVGPWTFDGIRRAIQARSRPLTLSFRDDFLTTEQRAVLTKAVMEVDAKCPPPRPTIPFGVRPPSTTPSITSALSHDTECFVNEHDFGKSNTLSPPEKDLSAWAQEKDCCHEKFVAASNSVSSHYSRLRRMSSSSHSTTQSNFRSFSEAGSSITSSFAPLVANLVKQASERNREDGDFTTPQYSYLRRGESLDNTPQHQDFQSNLL